MSTVSSTSTRSTTASRSVSAVFAGLPSGALAAGAFYSHLGATAAHDANDRIVYDTATGKLFYDADGAGGAAAKLFAIVIDHPHVLASDFSWREVSTEATYAGRGVTLCVGRNSEAYSAY